MGAFGGLDVVVDVIGEARWGNVLEFTDEDWEWSLATNLRQAFLLMQASAAPDGCAAHRRRHGGRVLGRLPHLGDQPRCVRRGEGGLVNMVKTFAEELGPFGIRANAILPGAVWSPTPDESEPPPGDATTPLRRPSMDDIARGLTFMVSDMARRGYRTGTARRRRRQHQERVGHTASLVPASTHQPDGRLT